ncbi:tail fiber domain-containing protein [Chryseobacterium sp. GMJ5]|uniref:Tail fiber domain-containing protein n=1 Tax=Chryseobacterium gilvum TaxID=2976534 RepID=A0ABT2VWX0_9FLAO|nr:tail fiber domain-containing protein [Chryseobacterium gilvum]MCU7614129.1 tail fiber domain-containing protein [Chryseobacterium gilvum]
MKKKLLLIAMCTSLYTYAQTGNVGINTSTPGSTLTLNGSFAATYKKVTANYTMTATDYYLAVENATAATITLPVVATASPSIQGRDYNIKNTGAGTVTIQASGTERFDNQSGNSVTSITLATGEYARIVATGNTIISTTTAQWEVAVVGNGQNVEPWNNQATLAPATANTQNIYQIGRVAIGANTSNGALSNNPTLRVVAPPTTDGIRLESTLTPGSYMQQSIVGDSNFLTFGVRDQTSQAAQTFIGSNSNTDFALRTNSLDRVTVKAGTGWVGISTDTPNTRLTIESDNLGGGGTDDIGIRSFGTGTSPGLIMYSGGNNATAPANLLTNSLVGSWQMRGHINGVQALTSQIQSIYTGNGITNLSTMSFLTSGGGIPDMFIDDNGYIGVGTTTPQSHLTVVGAAGNDDDIRIQSYNAASPFLVMENNGGSVATPSNVGNGDNLGGILWQARINGTVASTARIQSTYQGTGTNNLSDMLFQTSGANRIYINEQGAVGINTVDPSSKLSVVGDITTYASAAAIAPINSGSTTATISHSWLQSDGRISSYMTGAGCNLNLQRDAAPVNTPYARFYDGTSIVGSVIRSATGVTYATTSDIRLKTDIRPTVLGLSDLMKIQVSDYTFKKTGYKDQAGFIAQQLYKVFPIAVNPGGDDENSAPWMVDYGRITPLLVKAIQEQQAEIETLKAENAKLAATAADVKANADAYAQLAAQVKEMQQMLSGSKKAVGDKLGKN